MKSIDLGLSVDWGDTNLGAKKSSDYGIYLSWSSNSEDDTKGAPSGKHPDECISGIPEYDPCTRQLEDGWRLPTKEEFEELLHNCDIEIGTCDGKKGVLFVSKINGGQIFLPAAGCKSSLFFETGEYNIGKELYYWTADFDTQTPNNEGKFIAAFALESNDGNVQCRPSNYNWTVKYSIRPIKCKTI